MPEASRMPGKKLLLGLLAIFLFAVVPAVVLPTLVCRKDRKPPGDVGEVTPFSLVDERGQVFTEAAFRDHVTIVNFIFTRCDTICPVTSMKMERIQEKTFDVGKRVKLVSFSVDPKYDTPERLAEFAKKYRAKPERWRFVTGPVSDVIAVIEGPFMTAVEQKPDRPSGAPDFAHRGYFMLVDQKLRIRGIYDSDLIHQLDDLLADARYLVRTGGT